MWFYRVSCKHINQSYLLSTYFANLHCYRINIMLYENRILVNCNKNRKLTCNVDADLQIFWQPLIKKWISNKNLYIKIMIISWKCHIILYNAVKLFKAVVLKYELDNFWHITILLIPGTHWIFRHSYSSTKKSISISHFSTKAKYSLERNRFSRHDYQRIPII